MSAQMKSYIFTGPGVVLELKPGDRWVSVTEGVAGWFAVVWWINNVDQAPDVFPEPWESGIGRYATAAEAYVEAQAWAADLELPLELL